MKKINYSEASFLLSVAQLSQLPADIGFEVAFLGRSNAGKSSALNTISNLKNLARTSKTPGRTQCINLFKLDDERRLVDLPGYGYAKVPVAVSEGWQRTTNEYLRIRTCLKGLMLVMDARHPLKEMDMNVISWCVDCGIPCHVLLTKADKLSNTKAQQTLRQVIQYLQPFEAKLGAQLFSSLDHTGVEQARARLDSWFS